MKKVAFICVHNSCRSQIAEALGKKLASDVFESNSAGTETKNTFFGNPPSEESFFVSVGVFLPDVSSACL